MRLDDKFMLARVCKPGYLTSAEITRQHPIYGGMKGGKMKLSKPFKKAMKQADRVAQSHNSKKEIHKLCVMLKEAIHHG